jgi:aconitase A
MSTYIRRPPYWEGALAGERSLSGMRPLAVLGDNITTDHLSPSNAIMMDSAAGEYLVQDGLAGRGLQFLRDPPRRPPDGAARDLRQSDPEERDGAQCGRQGQGRFAGAHRAGRQVTRMWEAIETYMERKQPLIVIAGADYGQGSSRDWAAKGVRLAGVEAIVAEGFERIHRTNLVGMGVLPLEFKPGVNRLTLGLDGTETYRRDRRAHAARDADAGDQPPNGERVEVPVTCRLDTAEEVSIYEAGGVLQRFAQDFLANPRKGGMMESNSTCHINPKSKSPPPTCAAAPARASSSACRTCRSGAGAGQRRAMRCCCA